MMMDYNTAVKIKPRQTQRHYPATGIIDSSRVDFPLPFRTHLPELLGTEAEAMGEVERQNVYGFWADDSMAVESEETPEASGWLIDRRIKDPIRRHEAKTTAWPQSSTSDEASISRLTYRYFERVHDVWHGLSRPAPPKAELIATRTTADCEPAEGASATLLGDLLRLKHGWDGPDSLAPPETAKAIIPEVFSRLDRFILNSEVEVDASTGEIDFSWFFDDHTTSVTVGVLPSSRVVVIKSQLGQPSERVVLKKDELSRLGRAALDAGLYRINE